MFFSGFKNMIETVCLFILYKIYNIYTLNKI